MNYIKATVLSLVGVMAPIHAILITAFTLVVIDTITGIWAAKKRGETITSAKLRNSVSKFLIFNSAIISAFLVQNYMQFDIVPVVKLVSAAIGATELLSIVENANVILGTDIFKALISKLGSSNLPKE